jgi:hypothetical protein
MLLLTVIHQAPSGPFVIWELAVAAGTLYWEMYLVIMPAVVIRPSMTAYLSENTGNHRAPSGPAVI